MSERLRRWAPAGVVVAGAALVVLGGRAWAAELPVITAVGWAVAAAGLLAWFVGAVLRRVVGAVAAVLLLVALAVAVASGGGVWVAAAAFAAILGAAFSAVLVIQSAPRQRAGAADAQLDPWTALDRGEDPTAGPSANRQPT